MSRIEPRLLSEWMAFERLEPFGDLQADKRFKVLAAWLCTLLGSKAYAPDDIKGISAEIPPDLDEDADDAEPWDEADDSDFELRASDFPPTAAVLRDLKEQAIFR